MFKYLSLKFNIFIFEFDFLYISFTSAICINVEKNINDRRHTSLFFSVAIFGTKNN